MSQIPRIVISPCPKGYTRDLDKAVGPEETVRRARERMRASGLDILAETRRVDVGRLDIPVYMSVCGGDARRVMPTRKQMGKGSSPEQALASAVMELAERHAFFTFWERMPHMESATWSGAEARFGSALMPLEDIRRSVGDSLPDADLRRLMDLRRWLFHPATRLEDGAIVWIPLDWFKILNEFNGSSAGNTPEESILQGISELIERHVCCLADRERPVTPTIDADACDDAALQSLLAAFRRENIRLLLKDFSFGMPLPTVAALAWDESTFPESSEIVFTAGTACSPAKAAVRAVTEVAQLAGDFCTHACYEASGLPKFRRLEDAAWLQDGPVAPLDSLPSLERGDIRDELLAAVAGLAPLRAYAVETTHPALGIPAHVSVIPGLQFRERDRNQSVGLFVGRLLAERADADEAERGLRVIGECMPGAPFLPFFRGLIALRGDDRETARALFAEAAPLQPDDDAAALALFYEGHALTLDGRWDEALKPLREAFERCPDMKEYGSLLGVALFKAGSFAKAAERFEAVLKLDKGSAMDWANLGMCRRRLEQRKEALACLKTALSLDASLDFARGAVAELEEEGIGEAEAEER